MTLVETEETEAMPAWPGRFLLPSESTDIIATLPSFFQKRILVCPSCWPWTGALNVYGYGVIKHGEYKGMAHHRLCQQCDTERHRKRRQERTLGGSR